MGSTPLAGIESVIGAFFGVIIFATLPYILLFGGLIWAIRTRNNPNSLGEKFFGIKIYFQLLRTIALVLITVAIAMILKAGLAAVSNADFSYSKTELCESIRSAASKDSNYASSKDMDKYCSYSVLYAGTASSSSSSLYDYTSTSKTSTKVDYNSSEFKNDQQKFLNDKGSILIKKDLLNGITLLVIGFPLFVVHTLLHRRFNFEFDIIDKVYVIGISIIYGLIGISTLAAGLNGILSNALITSSATFLPGTFIAAAIATLPIWAYYVYRLVQLTKHSMYYPQSAPVATSTTVTTTTSN